MSAAAQLELRVEADGFEQLLAATASAIAALAPVSGPTEPDRLPVLAVGGELEELATGFVEDLLFLAEFEDFAVRRLERLELVGHSVRCAVSGTTGSVRPVAGAIAPASVVIEADAEGAPRALRLVIEVDLDAYGGRLPDSDGDGSWTWALA